MFKFTFNVTYFHRVIDIYCMHLYLVYQTLNIIFCVVFILYGAVGGHPLIHSYFMSLKSLSLSLVQGGRKLLDDGREIPNPQRKRSAIRFLILKSSLYLTKTWQVVICLVCFGVGMLVFYLKQIE